MAIKFKKMYKVSLIFTALIISISSYSNQIDSCFQIDRDSLVFNISSDSVQRLQCLEIVQLNFQNKNEFVLSDSLSRFENLNELSINMSGNLNVGHGMDSLKKLKEVRITGKLNTQSRISFLASRNSMELLVIRNYGEHMVFPIGIQFLTPKTRVTILQRCKKIQISNLVSFIQMAGISGVELYLTFDNISKKRVNHINNELLKRGVKYKISNE